MRTSVSHESVDRRAAAPAAHPRALAVILAGLALGLAWWLGSFSAWARGALVAFAAVLLVAALVNARFLTPLARGWLRVARVLAAVLDPLVLGMMYVLLFVPVGLAMRLARRDALHLRRDPAAPSYWIARDDPAAPGRGMRNQF